jgi:hypothetical protein
LVEQPGIDRLLDRVERERVAARLEMESFLQGLLEGPVRGEVERRFRAANGKSETADSGVGSA